MISGFMKHITRLLVLDKKNDFGRKMNLARNTRFLKTTKPLFTKHTILVLYKKPLFTKHTILVLYN